MSSTDPFVDILTVIDAKSIVEDFSNNRGSKDRPAGLGNNAGEYIYMLVKRSVVSGAEAYYELKVDVKTNDILRWRTASLTMNTGYSTLAYGMTVSAGAGLITSPQPFETSIKIPTPQLNGGSIGSVGTQPYKDFFFQTTAQQPGNVTYQIQFMLSDSEGKAWGYFTWDPYISISR
ncbi:AidA/PixA family protein [Hyalangium minutum]|uniref:AidA n=1 Tax=Hyalangium minutum TaxID=394096 RepID=A0A085W2R3_9BACT|nr:AidA/PixA family protein [Hyalangium minutum]KFE61976.1 AidA [Hyalangium minutum]